MNSNILRINLLWGNSSYISSIEKYIHLNWRTRYVPIRTFSEITTQIAIPVNKQPILYKIYALKAKQLRMLGMNYIAIARSLKISQETARKACHYEK